MPDITPFWDWQPIYRIGLIVCVVLVACILCVLGRNLIFPRFRPNTKNDVIKATLLLGIGVAFFASMYAVIVVVAFFGAAIQSYEPAVSVFGIAAFGFFAWQVLRYFLGRQPRK